MDSIVKGAARAASLALVFIATTAQAQSAPVAAAASASTVWELRSGLNVAALACRGEDEAAIVAGYNQLLTDHRAELANTFRAVAQDYGTPAAFDAAMTSLYNTFAQPATQAALCANARGVLDAMATDAGRPLTELAGGALARLESRDTVVMTQVAVASIPQILDQRQPEVEDGIPDGE